MNEQQAKGSHGSTPMKHGLEEMERDQQNGFFL